MTPICFSLVQYSHEYVADVPPRTPSKKQDEESVASSSKRDGSPILKKAPVTLQLRSKLSNMSPVNIYINILHRTFNSSRS